MARTTWERTIRMVLTGMGTVLVVRTAGGLFPARSQVTSTAAVEPIWNERLRPPVIRDAGTLNVLNQQGIGGKLTDAINAVGDYCPS